MHQGLWIPGAEGQRPSLEVKGFGVTSLSGGQGHSRNASARNLHPEARALAVGKPGSPCGSSRGVGRAGGSAEPAAVPLPRSPTARRTNRPSGPSGSQTHNAGQSSDTHIHRRPLLLHQAANGPARELPHAPNRPPQFWVRRPAPDPLPAGHCRRRRRQRAGAQPHFFFFFFPTFQSASLNNLALFKHEGVNNGHRVRGLREKGRAACLEPRGCAASGGLACPVPVSPCLCFPGLCLGASFLPGSPTLGSDPFAR